MLFNDTWSQQGHSVSCMTIHQATHKVGCQPGNFAYDHFNLPLGFVWVYGQGFDQACHPFFPVSQ